MVGSKNAVQEGFPEAKALDEYLADEEVVKAIVRIMLKSKAWQEHVQEHKDAKLRILATSGFHFKDEEKTMTSIVASIKDPRLEAPVVTSTETWDTYQGGYRAASAVPRPFMHSAQYGQTVNVSFGQNIGYEKGGNPNVGATQQVTAGCNCGLVMDISAKGVNMHTPDASTSAFKVSYSLMTNSYVNSSAGGTAGYNTKEQGSRYTTGF